MLKFSSIQKILVLKFSFTEISGAEKFSLLKISSTNICRRLLLKISDIKVSCCWKFCVLKIPVAQFSCCCCTFLVPKIPEAENWLPKFPVLKFLLSKFPVLKLQCRGFETPWVEHGSQVSKATFSFFIFKAFLMYISVVLPYASMRMTWSYSA